MEDTTGRDGETPPDAGQPSVSVDSALDRTDAAGLKADAEEGLAPDEAFQTLANEVRVAVLVELLAAERDGEAPLSFSRLQSATDSDSSAGFAYHLRQLSGYFVRRTDSGYVLTEAGQRTAEAVVSGTFTVGVDGGPAS